MYVEKILMRRLRRGEAYERGRRACRSPADVKEQSVAEGSHALPALPRIKIECFCRTLKTLKAGASA